MLIKEMLVKIREPWLSRISQELSKGEGGREPILVELNRFYDLLLQAVESGDSGWLKPILVEWASSRTETELEIDEISISPVFSVIVEKTIFVAKSNLQPSEVIDLYAVLLPIFTFCFEQIAQQESLVRVGYATTKLDKIKYDLEKLDRSKSDFIAVAAHELKTPLTLIEGYTAMLKDNLGEIEIDSPKQLLLEGIQNGTERLGEIIDDMIDISMIDNNLLSLNFQPTWLNRLFEVLHNEFAEIIKERNHNFTIEKFPGHDARIFADSERIYQALKNLIANAIKYTPDGGSIVIDGRTIPGFIEVTVTDSGIGIDIDDQYSIFDKFGGIGEVALHSSGKTKFKGGGPGLGLPITKGIFEAHGGTIWVESEGHDEKALHGSVFHVLLPMRTEPPDDKAAKLFVSHAEEEKA